MLTRYLKLWLSWFAPGFGSGGGGEASSEERALYQAQADKARADLDMFNRYGPRALESFVGLSQRYSDPAYREQMRSRAGADAAQAIGQNTAATTRALGRFGINPNSGRFAGVMSQNALGNAALQANAMNQAGRYVDDMALGASKDLYSTMVGLSSSAAQGLSNAAQGFGNMAANQQAQQQNNMMGVGALAGALPDWKNSGLWPFRDGGEVKMAQGGLLAAGPLPGQRPRQPEQTPTPNIPRGIQNTRDAMTGLSALQHGVAPATMEALGSAGLAAGSEQAAMLAAQEVGLTSGLGTALGTAVPLIGVAALLQSLFADGGEVQAPKSRRHRKMRKGGHVDGPGTETSDSIPARLSDGEYVVNAESMKIPGAREVVEAINAAGLARRYAEKGGV